MASSQLEVDRQRGTCILIVDDNRDTADTLAVLLAQRSYEALVAYDGEQALALATERRPDAVLLDISLPLINGYDVCRRLRSQPWGRNLCILAQTGWAQARARQETAAAGFDGHLVKPVDFDTLCQALEECLDVVARDAKDDRPSTSG